MYEESYFSFLHIDFCRHHSLLHHLDDLHGVVAENIHHLDGDFVASRLTFMEGVFNSSERSFLVRKDCHSFSKMKSPVQIFFHQLCRSCSFGGFLTRTISRFAFEVEIHAPVIDPVRPFLGQHFTGDDAVLILEDLNDLAVFHDDLVFACLSRFAAALSTVSCE